MKSEVTDTIDEGNEPFALHGCIEPDPHQDQRFAGMGEERG